VCVYKIAVNCNAEWMKVYDIAIKICNQTRDGKTEKLERLNNFMYKNGSIGICDPASKSLRTYNSWSLLVSFELLTK
jgi:hypothetical protein